MPIHLPGSGEGEDAEAVGDSGGHGGGQWESTEIDTDEYHDNPAGEMERLKMQDVGKEEPPSESAPGLLGSSTAPSRPAGGT